MIRSESKIQQQASISNIPGKRAIVFLFLAFSVSLVIPLISIPGGSISMPLFVLIVLILIRKYKISFAEYERWFFLIIWIGFAVLISAIGNGLLSGGIDINNYGINISVHYVYWLVVFVFIVYILSENIVSIEKVVVICGYAISAVGLLRLFEAVAWGKIGAWSSTRFFTQNTYGFLFSMFAPLILYGLYKKRKLFFVLQVLIIASAVLVNGSRGSWIALGSMLLVFLVALLFISPSAKNFGLVLLIGMFSLLSWALYQSFAPIGVQSAIESRFSSFDNLEDDKSYMIRVVMVQKGMRLFQESPIIGVGTARFNYEVTYLDLPQSLRYGSQAYFNTRSAHNSYVAFLAEQGLLGTIPYALLVIAIFVLGGLAMIKLVRRGNYWALGTYLSFISMSVHMWGISSLTNTANWMVYALNVSMIYAAQRQESIE